MISFIQNNERNVQNDRKKATKNGDIQEGSMIRLYFEAQNNRILNRTKGYIVN